MTRNAKQSSLKPARLCFVLSSDLPVLAWTNFRSKSFSVVSVRKSQRIPMNQSPRIVVNVVNDSHRAYFTGIHGSRSRNLTNHVKRVENRIPSTPCRVNIFRKAQPPISDSATVRAGVLVGTWEKLPSYLNRLCLCPQCIPAKFILRSPRIPCRWCVATVQVFHLLQYELLRSYGCTSPLPLVLTARAYFGKSNNFSLLCESYPSTNKALHFSFVG